MKDVSKNVRYRKGIAFASIFTLVYFCIGVLGIIIMEALLYGILGIKYNTEYEEWLFLGLTCCIMFYIALRFIYRDRESIKLLVENRKKLTIYKSIFDKMNEGLIITDNNGKIISVNKSFEETTKYSRKEVLGRTPSFLGSGMHSREFYSNMWKQIKQNGKWHGEIINRRKDGNIFPESLSITVIKDNNNKTSNYIGIFTDITEQRESAEKIEFLKHYDSLTRLPKYSLFQRHLHSQLEANEHMPFALFIIEIRKLKALNATIGYKIGDEIIQKVAIRLQQACKGMTIGRVNSKDFAIIQRNINNTTVALDWAKQLLKEIETPLFFGDQEFFVTANIGISLYPTHANGVEEIYQHADAAKATAKESNRPFVVFNNEIKESIKRKVVLESHLLRAIDKEELSLFYQPQVDVKTGKVMGLEALLRWNHPTFGMISPGEFIPVAEETGLILPIGDWILKTVCKQQKEWRDAGYPLIKIAINLSLKQFQQHDIVEKTKLIIEETNAEPSYLEFEITESISMLQTEEMIKTLTELKALGIEVSIDDFGTGHSSLSYLQQLPIDNLKIDRSFVWDIPANQGNIALTRAIIAMAHQLNLAVIAEGVETKEQLEFLKELNCEFAQGYYFSKPIPATDVTDLLFYETYDHWDFAFNQQK